MAFWQYGFPHWPGRPWSILWHIILDPVLFIPAITMRSLAEETRSGTIELLRTKAVTDWEIVVGKFLAALILVCIALACTIPYYLTVSTLEMLITVEYGAAILVWSYCQLAISVLAFLPVAPPITRSCLSCWHFLSGCSSRSFLTSCHQASPEPWAPSLIS